MKLLITFNTISMKNMVNQTLHTVKLQNYSAFLAKTKIIALIMKFNYFQLFIKLSVGEHQEIMEMGLIQVDT